MLTSHRVAVYGDTLALAGIALALERHPQFQVVTLEFGAKTLAHQLQAFSPRAVIFDTAQTEAHTILTCAQGCGDLLVIGIQANSDRMQLWSGHSAQALTIQDLAQAILAGEAATHNLNHG